MRFSSLLLVSLAVGLTALLAMAYVHPQDCYFTVNGIQDMPVGQYAVDDPGEPGAGGWSTCFYNGTNKCPDSQCQDSWIDLPQESNASGGGTAYQEGEAWHRVDITGTWQFTHWVEQPWFGVAETDTEEMDEEHTPAAHARARAYIYDDRAQRTCETPMIIEASGDSDEKRVFPMLSTSAAPDSFTGGENGWLNLCGRTQSLTDDQWCGRARAWAVAMARSDIVIYITDILDIG